MKGTREKEEFKRGKRGTVSFKSRIKVFTQLRPEFVIVEAEAMSPQR